MKAIGEYHSWLQYIPRKHLQHSIKHEPDKVLVNSLIIILTIDECVRIISIAPFTHLRISAHRNATHIQYDTHTYKSREYLHKYADSHEYPSGIHHTLKSVKSISNYIVDINISTSTVHDCLICDNT